MREQKELQHLQEVGECNESRGTNLERSEAEIEFGKQFKLCWIWTDRTTTLYGITVVGKAKYRRRWEFLKF